MTTTSWCFHQLVFVVDVGEYEPPTYYSFKDIKKHTVGRRLTELPFTYSFGADPAFHETEKSRVECCALYWMDELLCTFSYQPLLPAATVQHMKEEPEG